MRQDKRELLADGAQTFGVDIDTTAIDQFAKLSSLLESGNRRLNLTRIHPDDYVTHHYLDSLALASVIHPNDAGSLIDIGAGAGFPGLPLAIAYPRLNVTMLDSTRKKLDYVNDAARELGLTNVTTVHGRAEEMCRDIRHKRAYSIAVARAVARLDRLIGWMLPFVRKGGVAVAYKSEGAAEEIADSSKQIERAGGEIQRVETIRIPGTEIVRKMVVVGHRLRA